ncbi:hypothetical protein GQ457_04G008620 [Hibiscus cannabinus]
MIENAPIVSFLNKPVVERLILNLAVFGSVKEFVADFGKDFVKDSDFGKDFVENSDFGKDFETIKDTDSKMSNWMCEEPWKPQPLMKLTIKNEIWRLLGVAEFSFLKTQKRTEGKRIREAFGHQKDDSRTKAWVWLIMISTFRNFELFYYGPTNRTSSDEIIKQMGQLTFPIADEPPHR